MWATTHAYIEHISLGGALPLLPQDEQLYHLAEDDAELSFSGAHQGGGTDPRLPFSVRNAVRAAFIAQHYGAKALTVHNADATIHTVDAGVLEAERYLLFALAEARQAGFHLPDQAVVELESRLAGLRERQGGSVGLQAARVSYERIFDALSEAASSSSATSTSPDPDWLRRASSRAARKVGEVSLRMTTELGALEERASAEKWLLRSAKLALRVPENAVVIQTSNNNSHTATSKGWFSFWSSSSSNSSSAPTLGRQPVDALVASLEDQPFLLPVDARSLFTTLTTLSALYAQTSLPTALRLLSAALALAPPKPAHSEDLASKVHDSYISARHALLQTFEGEIALAARPGSDPRMGLLKASHSARDTSAELHKTGLTADPSILSAVWTALFGSAQQKAAERLRSRVALTDRDARTAASTAYFLLGLIHERARRNSEALEAYLSAMKLAADRTEVEDLTKPLGEKADQAGFRRAYTAHAKLKESME